MLTLGAVGDRACPSGLGTVDERAGPGGMASGLVEPGSAANIPRL